MSSKEHITFREVNVLEIFNHCELEEIHTCRFVLQEFEES